MWDTEKVRRSISCKVGMLWLNSEGCLDHSRRRCVSLLLLLITANEVKMSPIHPVMDRIITFSVLIRGSDCWDISSITLSLTHFFYRHHLYQNNVQYDYAQTCVVQISSNQQFQYYYLLLELCVMSVTVILTNSERIITFFCSFPLVCGAFDHLSACCSFVCLTAYNFTVLIHFTGSHQCWFQPLQAAFSPRQSSDSLPSQR